MIAMYLNYLGVFHLELYRIPGFDKVMHAIGFFVLAYVCKEKWDISYKYIFIALLIVGLGYEVFEYIVDSVINIPALKMWLGWHDTIGDIICDMIGILFGLMLKGRKEWLNQNKSYSYLDS
jgi:hypothetical protein